MHSPLIRSVRTDLAPARRVASGLTALVLLLGAAGCSSGSEDPDGAEATGSAGTSASPSGEDSPTDGGSGQEGGDEGGDEGGEPDQEQPESTQVFADMGDDFRGILSDVDVEECPTTKGDVEARGTVENTADEPQDIFIGVIWLKPDSGDSLALGEFTAQDVGAGETVDWSVEATLKAKPGQCVLQAKANDVGTLQ